MRCRSLRCLRCLRRTCGFAGGGVGAGSDCCRALMVVELTSTCQTFQSGDFSVWVLRCLAKIMFCHIEHISPFVATLSSGLVKHKKPSAPRNKLHLHTSRTPAWAPTRHLPSTPATQKPEMPEMPETHLRFCRGAVLQGRGNRIAAEPCWWWS